MEIIQKGYIKDKKLEFKQGDLLKVKTLNGVFYIGEFKRFRTTFFRPRNQIVLESSSGFNGGYYFIDLKDIESIEIFKK